MTVTTVKKKPVARKDRTVVEFLSVSVFLVLDDLYRRCIHDRIEALPNQ